MGVSSLSEFLRLFCHVKETHNCDFDDIIILLGCCVINGAYMHSGNFTLQPANVNSISDYISVARETVRRRINLLERKGLVERYPLGYVIVEEETVANLVSLIKGNLA
jgi:DNA-binding transcriptional ArsR family regulator